MFMIRRNNYSNWLDNFFDDSLSGTEQMPQRNTTTPALNVKESAEDYIMEMAVPGLEKEWVRINVTNEGTQGGEQGQPQVSPHTLPAPRVCLWQLRAELHSTG